MTTSSTVSISSAIASGSPSPMSCSQGEGDIVSTFMLRYGVVIGGRFYNLTFNGLTIRQTDASGPCINFHNPRNVVIDGILAEGGSSLLGCATAPTYFPTDCVIRNGTYKGPEIGKVPGVTVTNVTLL